MQFAVLQKVFFELCRCFWREGEVVWSLHEEVVCKFLAVLHLHTPSFAGMPEEQQSTQKAAAARNK